MATLEDKILGERAHCYCSSSESDDEKSDTASDEENISPTQDAKGATVSEPEPYKWQGSSTNTGPKGVVNDWQRFKQLQVEKRAEQERERIALINKLSLTCKSALEEEREKTTEVDPDIAEMLADDFLLEYQKKRMEEMMSQMSSLPKFGDFLELKDRKQFLEAVDKENKCVTILIHIYEKNVPSCETMNGCLRVLCQEYRKVKFCRILASAAGVSQHFKANGVPALLVYKNGQLIGNFVRMGEELGEDFFADDVENFLREHAMLPDKDCTPSIIKSQVEDDDSDLSLE